MNKRNEGEDREEEEEERGKYHGNREDFKLMSKSKRPKSFSFGDNCKSINVLIMENNTKKGKGMDASNDNEGTSKDNKILKRELEEIKEDNIKQRLRNERITGDLWRKGEEIEEVKRKVDKLEKEKTEIITKLEKTENKVVEKDKEIIAKDTEIKILKNQLKNVELELYKASVNLLEDKEGIKEEVAIGPRYTKTSVGYMLYESETAKMDIVRALSLFSSIKLKHKPKDYYLKKINNGGQMTFGVIYGGVKEIGLDDKCIVCDKRFNNGMGAVITKAQHGTSMDHDIQKLKAGPICGYHTSGKDVETKPINLMF